MRDTGLLEREDELRALDDVLAAARAHAGAALLLEGPPGIGKSALLDVARERATDLRVLVARGAELEREFSFGVARLLLERPVREASEEQRARWLAGSAGMAAGLLGATADGGDAELSALVHGLYWLTAAIAADGPTLLLIDDAHWADAGSLRFVAHLARRLEGLPLALIVAARPGGESGEGDAALRMLTAEAAVEVRRPQPLSLAGTGALISENLGNPDDSFVAACHQASGGNPFVLSELLAVATAARVPPTASEAENVARLASKGLQREIASRLAAIGDKATAVVRAIAILGDEAEPHHAAALAGVDMADAAQAIAQLADVHVLARTARPTFVHSLLRTAVLQDLGQPGEALAHSRAAQLLHRAGAPKERVAAHLMVCRPIGEGWAVEALAAAAHDARRQGAQETAGRLLERALEEGPEPEVRRQILQEAASAWLTAGEPRGLRHLAAARDELTDPVARAVLALRACAQLWFLGRADSLGPMLREAIAELPAERAELLLALRSARAQSVMFGSGEQIEALLDEATAAIPPASLDEPGARGPIGFLALASLSANQPVAEAVRLARLALGDPRQLRQAIEAGYPQVPALGTLIYAAEDAGVPEALAMIEHRSRARGALFSLGGVLGWRARWHLLRGRLLEAETDARAAIELSAGGRGGPGRHATDVLAVALLEQGQAEEALELASAAAGSPRAAGISRAQPLLAEARVLLAIGRPSEARAACARVHEEAIHCAIDCPAVLPWRTVAALAALTMGEQPDAVRLAREELELAEASGVQAAVGVARRTLGLATTDVDELAAAVHLLSKTPAALEHTRALVDLGASLRRLGSRTEARGLLAEALDRALGAGATTLAERAHVELLATGARPRSLVRTGVDALTPSELRVATLAAQGLTNREIAQHLFVAPKTAETHLYAAFRKLEIRRRADLGSALGRQSSGGPPDAKPPGNRHDRESR